MKYVDPPFMLGETLKGTDDDGNEINSHWEGQIFELPDVDVSASSIRGSKSRQGGRQIKAVICRNSKGSALTAAKKVLKFDIGTSNSRNALGRITAQSGGTAEWAGIGDQYLSSTVADKELFWVILEGPCKVTTNSGSSAVAVGDILVSAASGEAAEIGASADAIDGVNAIARALQTSDGSDEILVSACVRH